jgi:D-amino peptidase
MKIYLMTDLEGVSGVVEFEDRKDESPRNHALRQRYSRLLTGEVNAAVAGAFAAEATEVVVDDSHGRGYTIDPELLDERVRVIHGSGRPRIMPGIDETFDAMLMVGAHAMARTRGAVLYHTMSCGVREIRINGTPMGEIGIFAFVAGAFGVPMVLCTGDTAACREAAGLVPGIVTAAVKEGLSRYAAVSQSPAVACRMIRDAAERSLAQRDKVKPLVLDPPFTYQEDTYPNEADSRASHPADLPATWTTGQLITAPTACELIDRVWRREV